MLETLRIQDFALIDSLEADFAPGFNALTGETGAGKSIIIGALNLVLGARASAEAVRQGAAKAKIDAVFRLERPSKRLAGLLAEHDIEITNGELILSRVIGADGRGRAYAGGSLVPLTVLAAIGDELVDLHGQHEHQSLLRPDRQLDLVDAYAGLEAQVDRMETCAGQLRALERDVAALESDDREQTRRIEFLKFEVGEINGAGLAQDEEEDLRSRRNRITHAERICQVAEHARAVLYEGDESTAIAAVGAALNDLDELSAIDSRFEELAPTLAAVRAEIEDVAERLRDLGRDLEFSPEELETINGRLAQIASLKRKYGASIEAILEYRDQAETEIRAYASRDERLAALRAQREAALQEAESTARDLSAARAAAVRKLDAAVTSALQHLGMKGGRFEAHLEPVALGPNGIDRVEFYLSANPGEKPRPLRTIASGGEISRIMLALKTVFARADRIPTLVFDEIDAGVGGQTARSVATRLSSLASTHQVICITHIAQIAAAASAHFRVTKSTSKNRTTTTLDAVVKDERVNEVARLLDGSLTPVSLEHARTLLDQQHAESA